MRKSLVAILAVAAVLTPALASAQSTDKPSGNAAAYKYQVFVGAGYTSLNQVNQSRYGLIGADIAVNRDWGKYFALTADGSFYSHSLGTGNPGNPSVDMVLLGPELHGNIFEHLSIFFHGLLGGAHTGGENMNPDTSFAGGVGAGMDYRLNPRISVRAWGDDIGSSFSLINNTTELGNSPHRRFNSRASIGIAYRF